MQWGSVEVTDFAKPLRCVHVYDIALQGHLTMNVSGSRRDDIWLLPACYVSVRFPRPQTVRAVSADDKQKRKAGVDGADIIDHSLHLGRQSSGGCDQEVST